MAKAQKIKTPQQVREELKSKGMPIAEYARQKSLDLQLVYDILSGRNKATYGESHRIAVALGIKNGEAEAVNQ